MARLPMRDAAALLEPLVGSGPEGLDQAPGPRPVTLSAVRTSADSPTREDERSASFEAFFQAEYPSVLRAMYLVTGDRHEAEEIAQDAFVRACERWDMVSGAQNVAGYVYRMALNGYRSKLRRLARGARKMVRPQDPPDLFEAVDDRDAIGRALSGLSEGQREAIVLVEWLGMTDDQVGSLLGISPITVRVRIHRARAILRPLLEAGAEG